MDNCNALESFKEKDFVALKNHLESDGYFLDENDDVYLGSGLMEKCKTTIEKKLRTFGYTGGSLLGTAKYYPRHGAIYAIFDSNQLNYLRTEAALDKWAKAH